MDAKILIVGQSHTEALAKALRRQGDPGIEVVNVNRKDRKTSLEEKIRVGGHIPAPAGFDLVVSMIGGNFHNTFGLIENPERFEFIEPGETGFTPTPGRQLISYGLLHHFFSESLTKGYLRNIPLLRDYYGARFLQVSTPPPVEDNDHILNNPGGYFSDKVQLGVAPPALRLKLYRLHETVLQAFCRREEIALLPPPPAALTAAGFLDRPFWNNDPTHANAAYGALVLDQIRGALRDG
ncbi:MAG: hypothetical protein ACR652_08805 [Methylocystis sp.]|uniref:hypothetical protein n=1 Tax=Methylocystis sp. TaxID=1911079 RepID=UPI003DA50162